MIIGHMYFRYILLLAIFAEVCGLNAQAPPTSQVWLHEHGVSFTIPALRSALASPDADVRGVAAGVLAEARDMNSISLISAALDKETLPRVRITLAAALSTLEKHRGDASLHKMCNDQSSQPTTRLMVANKLLDLKNEVCTPAVISMVGKNEPDPPARQLALQYLRRVTKAPAPLLPQLRAFLLKELRDPAPMNRQYAGECLSIFGDEADVREIHTIIAQEQDDATRKHLEDNLKRLQARLK